MRCSIGREKQACRTHKRAEMGEERPVRGIEAKAKAGQKKHEAVA